MTTNNFKQIKKDSKKIAIIKLLKNVKTVTNPRDYLYYNVDTM